MVASSEFLYQKGWRGWGQRCIYLLISPRKFFSISDWGEPFWVPIVIVSILLVTLRLAQFPTLKEQFRQPEYILQIAKIQRITEEDARLYLQRIERLYPIGSVIESFLMVTAGVSGAALLIYGPARWIFRLPVPYLSHLQLTSWTSLISAIPFLIHVHFALSHSDFQLPINLGYVLPAANEQCRIIRFAQVVDPFLLWQLIVLSLGLKSLYRISFLRALFFVIPFWILFGVLYTIVG